MDLDEEDVEIVIDEYGTKRWYQNGFLHRLDGPAIEWKEGGKEWYVNGELHRLDGPARIWIDGTKVWFQQNILHRDDGPAVEQYFGRKKTFDYWIHGKKLDVPNDKRLTMKQLKLYITFM